MSRKIIFLTHADVAVDPAVPVPEWGLNARGAERHQSFAQSAHVGEVSAIYASTERKAQQGAAPVGARLGLPVVAVHALHENDRSATGYLPEDEFQRTADAFFASPDTSIRGWERARAAQARICAALRTLADLDQSGGDILVVAHGGVGTLLRCHTKAAPICRSEDQPPNGGGNWFVTDTTLTQPATEWSAI